MKSVVLLSGGLDSTIALHWALQRGPVLAAVSVNYNQRHWVEVGQAGKIARAAKVPHEIEQLGGRGIGLNAARNRLVVLLDDDEWAQLDAYVAKRGHDRSHWVRLALRKIGALK